MSDKPTDLNSYRNAKAGPDADCMVKDGYGRPLYTFLLSYQMDDRNYGAEIEAYSEQEALRKVEAMKQSLIYNGQLYSGIVP